MSTEVMDRTEAETIRQLARAEAELFDAWLESEDEPAPGVEYWSAFDAWVHAYDRRALPIAAREMEDLAREHAEWDASGDDEPDPKFWYARQEANKACLKEPPTLDPIKSPAELVADKVSHRQIAKIWNLLLPDGEPDIVRVEAELANPGSVITPEHLAMVDQRRLAALGFVADPDWTDEPEEPAPPAAIPASLDRMIADRANIGQIARAKAEQYGTPETAWQEILPALASLMGVTLAQNASATVNEGGQSVAERKFGEQFVQRGQHVAPQIDETEITLKADDEDPAEPAPEDPEAKIVTLFEAGQDVTAIAREIGWSPKRVKAAIKRWEQGIQGQESGEA